MISMRAVLSASLFVALAGCTPDTTPTPHTPDVPTSTPVAPAVPSVSPTASPAAPSNPVAASFPVPKELQALVDAADRSDADRALDAGRHPGELLAFLGIKPGMKVAELGSGGGYTTELLARAVGPTGVVYGQNSKFILDRFAEKPWSERLAKPVMKNVVRVNLELDEPLPGAAHDLDGVVIVLFYHDSVWMKTDRDKMNAAVYKALKPGGFYAIVDHSGRKGTGSTETQTLHRIEQEAVVLEVQKAGFKLGAEGAFLRNPADTRDWNDSPKEAGDRRGTSDRFVLKFVK